MVAAPAGGDDVYQLVASAPRQWRQMFFRRAPNGEWFAAEIAASPEPKKLPFPFNLFVTGHCEKLSLPKFVSTTFRQTYASSMT
jgi:hypothetical protein